MSSLVICLFVERKAIEFHVLVRSQVHHKRNKIRTAEISDTLACRHCATFFFEINTFKVVMDPNRCRELQESFRELFSY